MLRRNWPVVGYVILTAFVTLAFVIQGVRIHHLAQREHVVRCAVVHLATGSDTEAQIRAVLGNPHCP